jgi:gamma-glutamyltranspeptidase/glutathione hydrolase
VQVVLAMVVDAMDSQAALDAPRVCLGPDGDVALEEGVDAAVCDALTDMGHAVRVVRGHQRALFGRGQIICRDTDNGVLCGGSDLRADGCALGL